METHHPHHITHKKKWTEYLLEFFMLFLAVFLGFVAENIREHRVEKDREKQLVESLLFDLQKDSSFLYNNLRTGPSIVTYGDSLRLILRQVPLKGKEIKIYYYLSLYNRGLTWRYYDRTIVQLKNSGAFRLIKNNNVSNLIMDYDILMRGVMENLHVRIENLVQEDIRKQNKLFDGELSDYIKIQLLDSNKTIEQINFPYKLTLQSYDEKEIKEFINITANAGGSDKLLLKYSEQAFLKNRLLDSVIKKEYHLEKK